MIKHLSPLLILLFTSMGMMQPSFAKPDLTTPIDMSVLYDTSSGYHFVTQRFLAPAPTSVVAGDEVYAKPRHYQVWLGIPNGLSSSQDKLNTATSVIYMLDGNGVIDDLKLNQLQALAQSVNPPVLVFIGYQTSIRFDVNARAYDYTPALLSQLDVNLDNKQEDLDNKQKEGMGANSQLTQAFKESNRDRLNGGAEVFYRQIQTKIKPWVNAQLGYTPNHQALWGHSYGGLFVLYTLFQHPEAFDRYYSVDPSLWWQDGEIIKQYQTAKQKLFVQDELPYVRLTFSSSAVGQADSNTKDNFGNMLCSDWQAMSGHEQDNVVGQTGSKPRCGYQSYQQSHGELFNTGLLDMLADY